MVATLRRVSGGEVLQRYRLSEDTIVLGRDSTCDIVLKGAGISRRHCMLVRSDEGYNLVDLNSVNGTIYAGARLKDSDGNVYPVRLAFYSHFL